MVGVVVVVLLMAVFNGGFTFSPGRPTAGPAPTADVIGGFTRAQRAVTIPIVVPRDIPSGWHPNSFKLDDPAVDGGDEPVAVRGGWVTQGGQFIMLVQSAGSVSAVLTGEVGAVGPDNGIVRAGGADWTETTGMRAEVAWVRREGPVTYLITGSAPANDFRTLAQSIAH